MPHLKELYGRYKDQGLVLIGVHSDKNTAEGEKVAKELGMNYPIAFDPEGKLMKAFGCDSFPDYVVIDRKGTVRVVDLANAEVDKAVEALLKEKA